ncbi:amidohydrolase family protein [Photobacterium makurazakiensis]|uniref:amidohydrolase n=1 Tax=Photobacterium makurazakiensis TaxID=2910234 RepID=UPI003D0A33D0
MKILCYVVLSLYLSVAKAAIYFDTLITNGQVYRSPANTVIGINNGVISFLGKLTEARSFITSNTEIIDVEGAAIYPGFIELHAHVFDNIMFSHSTCRVVLEDAAIGLAKCMDQTKQWPNERWVLGYSNDLLTRSFPMATPRDWLDHYFPDRPVVVSKPHSSIVWLNSRAMDEVKITRYSANPLGGRIIRDDNDRPNGVLIGSIAEKALIKAVGSHPIVMPSLMERYQSKIASFHRQGITSLAEGGSLWRMGSIDFWNKMHETGQLKIRVSVRPRLSPFGGVNEQLSQLKAIFRNDFGSSLIINQVKIAVDGQYHLGTARLSSPYRTPAIKQEAKGIFYFSPTELNTWLQRLQTLGYGAYVQAEGDAAVEATLYSIANARRFSSDQRFTLSDMHFIKPEMFALLDKHNVSVSFTDLHNEAYLSREVKVDIPNSSAKKVTLAALLEKKIKPALSSVGFNAQEVTPLVRISQSLQLGRHGFQDVHQAIDSYTIEPARALGIEAITGSIVLGKSADFAIVDKVVTSLPFSEIANANILMTIFQGKTVYSRDSNQG